MKLAFLEKCAVKIVLMHEVGCGTCMDPETTYPLLCVVSGCLYAYLLKELYMFFSYKVQI